jgi:hypothetical protein
MSDFKNRLGQDNFVWWIGVVEDRDDPLRLGRCRVRIFGSHTEDLNYIPTGALPWASPLYPVNDSKSYSSPMEGDYIFGFFMDGLSSQVPTMLGVFPSIPQAEPEPGTGFSALAKIYSPLIEKSNTEIQKVQNSEFWKNQPVVPSVAPAMKLIQPGKPTTPANAYTANNTILSWTNNNLAHGCDFRFLIDIGDLGIGVLENPIKLIQDAIKGAKNKAAAIIRTLLAQLLSGFRIGLKAITVSLNLDPTGQLSAAFSKVREVIRTINYYSRKLAEIVGEIALVIALVQELKQIVEWIKSLPAKILGLLRDCLATFLGAIKSATSQIQAIPGQISNGLVGAFQSLETNASGAIEQAQAAAASANIPNTMITMITSPDSANANIITQYITSQYPNSNVIIANSESSSFNVANSSTP